MLNAISGDEILALPVDFSFLSFDVQAVNREDAFARLTLYRTPIACSSCPIFYLSKA